jgi:chemotaxis family two-component system response regulator Rcp1
MTSPSGQEPIRILLVEDNAGDIRLLEETLRESPLATEIKVVRNGVDAMSFLRRWGAFATELRPDMVLLDLNLPRMDGREVLAEVRSDPGLNGIPIVIFTSSPADEDVRLAFNFHADGYVRKPLQVREFLELVRRLDIRPTEPAT